MDYCVVGCLFLFYLGVLVLSLFVLVGLICRFLACLFDCGVVNDLFLVWHFCFVVFNYGCGMSVSCCWLCWLLVVGLGFVLVDFVVLVFVACVLFRWTCFGFCWCLLMLGCGYFGSVLLTVWFRRCFVYLVVNLVVWCALCVYIMDITWFLCFDVGGFVWWLICV